MTDDTYFITALHLIRSCNLLFYLNRNKNCREKLITFGGGSRICVGEKLVRSVLKVHNSHFENI